MGPKNTMTDRSGAADKKDLKGSGSAYSMETFQASQGSKAPAMTPSEEYYGGASAPMTVKKTSTPTVKNVGVHSADQSSTA
jgi:hypothetical protein